MHEPMVWNNLNEAAEWLTAATGKTWSVKQVLDAAYIRNTNELLDFIGPNTIPLSKHVLITCLEAVLPRGTQFAYYERLEEKVTQDNPNGLVRKYSTKTNRIQLTREHLEQLLFHGEVRVGVAKYPNPKFGEEYVMLIEPLEQEHIVNIDMIGISKDELKALAQSAGNNSHEQDDLKDSERSSLFKLILGMAIAGYKFNPQAEKNTAISDITEDLQKLGIGMSDDTVRKWINKAGEKFPNVGKA